MTHIQKAVQLVGDRGKYQKILLAIFILVYLELGLILLGSSFVFMNPIFNCPDLDSPTEDQACSRNCPVVNDYTATYYAGLYCDGQTDRDLIQSFVYIGAIVGLLVLTPFSDSIGKKRLLVLSQGLIIFGIVMNIIGVSTITPFVIIIGQLCAGAGCYSVLIVGYVIISELTQDKFKQYSIILLNVVWALTQIVISGLYFWFNYWLDFFLFIILIPNILGFIGTFFFLVESPYFLLEVKKDLPLALAALKKIGTINGADQTSLGNIEEQLKLALREVQQRESLAEAHHAGGSSRFAIFKDWKHLKILLAVAALEFGINAYYYGVQFSLGQIGTDFGYNILLTGLIQTTAFFISNAFITKLPRRIGLLCINILCVVMGLLFFVEFPTVMQTILLGTCRFFNTFGMAVIPMMQNQPFPHKYRAVAWGYIEGLSQIGNFITPFIVTACENLGVNPVIVFSFMLSAIGTLPLLVYRQTLNQSEDTLVAIEDAQDLKQSMRTQDSNADIENGLLQNKKQ